MKRDGPGSGSERSLTLQRSKRRRAHDSRSSKRAQEDPGKGGVPQEARVPRRVPGEPRSRDKTQACEVYAPAPENPALLIPIPGEQGSAPGNSGAAAAPDNPEKPNYSQELTHYKGIGLVNVGKDPKTGKVIPHKRSERLAKQIKVWVAGGFTLNDIAIRINVRPGLLKQHYGKELATGETEVHMDVHNHLLKRVKQSDRMAIFYAKARMGYRDGDARPQDTELLNIHLHL